MNLELSRSQVTELINSLTVTLMETRVKMNEYADREAYEFVFKKYEGKYQDTDNLIAYLSDKMKEPEVEDIVIEPNVTLYPVKKQKTKSKKSTKSTKKDVVMHGVNSKDRAAYSKNSKNESFPGSPEQHPQEEDLVYSGTHLSVSIQK